MAGEGEFTAAMQEASPDDHLDFFVPAAVAIEISRVCAGVLVSYGVSYGQVAGTDPEVGHAGADRALGSGPHERRGRRRLGAHRAGRGVGRVRVDADDGAQPTATPTC
jgi:hypothetical protein